MIGAVIGVPATAYVLAPVFDEASFEPVVLGTERHVRRRAEGQFKPTPPPSSRTQPSPRPARRLAWVYNTGKANTDWLAADAMFIVFSNRCMHLGCPVVAAPRRASPAPATAASTTQQGQRTAGPPIRPLDRYQWEIQRADELWVTKRWSVDFVDGKLTYYPVKMPGQPVALPGAEIVQDTVPDILYPERHLRATAPCRRRSSRCRSRSPHLPVPSRWSSAPRTGSSTAPGFPTLVRKFLFRKRAAHRAGSTPWAARC